VSRYSPLVRKVLLDLCDGLLADGVTLVDVRELRAAAERSNASPRRSV
jgi:hypothetical protein